MACGHTQRLMILVTVLFLAGCAALGDQAVTKIPQPTIIKTVEITETPRATLNPNEEASKGIETGDEIVDAIENYHKDKGQYPKSLDDLIPEYLEKIPVTVTGEEYKYGVFEVEGFGPYSLHFSIAGDGWMGGCVYSTKYSAWECGPRNTP